MEERIVVYGALETDHKPRLRRFSGLFWLFFDHFKRGNIRKLILPLLKWSKKSLKEPEKRQKLGLWSVSYRRPLKRNWYSVVFFLVEIQG